MEGLRQNNEFPFLSHIINNLLNIKEIYETLYSHILSAQIAVQGKNNLQKKLLCNNKIIKGSRTSLYVANLFPICRRNVPNLSQAGSLYVAPPSQSVAEQALAKLVISKLRLSTNQRYY